MKIKYKIVNGYLLPELELQKKTNNHINKYGMILLNYLKENKKIFYTELLMSNELNSYLFSVGKEIEDRVKGLTKLLAEREGVNETIKTTNQLLWVRKMNGCKNRAEEIILNEMVYNL